MFKLAKLAKRKAPDTTDGPPDRETLQALIIDAIKTVYDPEIPVNIYDLGLIYSIKIDDLYHASIEMTLTSPACPIAESLPQQVQSVASSVIGISDVQVKLVWDPPWTKEVMTEEAMLELGLL